MTKCHIFTIPISCLFESFVLICHYYLKPKQGSYTFNMSHCFNKINVDYIPVCVLIPWCYYRLYSIILKEIMEKKISFWYQHLKLQCLVCNSYIYFVWKTCVGYLYLYMYIYAYHIHYIFHWNVIIICWLPIPSVCILFVSNSNSL